MTPDQLLERSMLSCDPKKRLYADAYIQAISDLSETTGQDFTELTPDQQALWISTCHDLARLSMTCETTK